MKFLLAVSLSAFALGAFAAEDLNTMKSSANRRIDEQLNTLQSSKTCVNGAATVEAFKACKVDAGTGSSIQKEEEVIRTQSVEKKKDLSGQAKDKYDETKEKFDDAM